MATKNINKPRVRDHFTPSDRKTDLTFKKPSLTKQVFQEECDINRIVEQFTRTGIVTHVAQKEGQYGDAPSFTYHESMNALLEAGAAWEAVPQEIRDHCANDPQELLNIIEDPARVNEARSLGLLVGEPTPDPSESATPHRGEQGDAESVSAEPSTTDGE